MKVPDKNEIIGLAALLLVPVIYQIAYIQSVTVNVAWLTWFEQTPRLEKAFEHTLKLSDLFSRYGEHGMFGYNCLAIINAKLFSLNTFFDAYIYLSALLLCGFLLVRWANRTLGSGHKWLKWGTLASIVIVWFSVTQKSAGGMDTQVRLSMCAVVLNAILFARIMEPGYSSRGRMTVVCLAILICSLIVFGTSYSFGWLPALVLAAIASSWITRRDRWFPTALLLGVVGGVALYLVLYPFMGHAEGGGKLSSSFFAVVIHPWEAMKFLVSYLGSGCLANGFWSAQVIPADPWMWINGGIVSAAYGFALILFFKRRYFERSWLPLLLIGHTVGVGMLILLGRWLMFGWQGGVNPWYSIHHRAGLVALLWIMSCYWSETSSTSSFQRLPRTFIAVFGVYVACALGVSEYMEWRQVPATKGFCQNMVGYAFHPNLANVDAEGHTPLKASVSETVRSLAFYRKYRLNIYHDLAPRQYTKVLMDRGLCADLSALGDGWYSIEGQYRWIAKHAELFAFSGEEGLCIIAGYAPDFQEGRRLVVSSDNGSSSTVTLHQGLFEVILRVEKSSDVIIRLDCEHAEGPGQIGSGKDLRVLGLVINSIWLN